MSFKKHKQYRLPYFNYASSAYYFVTICTAHRSPLFGVIEQGSMNLSQIGTIVYQCWENIPRSSPYAAIDVCVVMPDHFHGILCLNNLDEERSIPEKKFEPQKHSLSVVVRNFKSAVTIHAKRLDRNVTIWQPRFYDRIIRNEKELQSVRKYIEDNPVQWAAEKENSENLLI